MAQRSLLHGFSRVLKAHSFHGALAPNHMVSRAMSRLFVGGLSFRTEEDGLRTAFAKHGEVIDCRIVTDRETGRSRGFGFVTFLSEADAETAITKMDGQFLDGRVVRVNKATPRPAPPRFNLEAAGLGSDAPSDDSSPPVAQDWGTISSPIASVPQNAGLTFSDTGSASPVSAASQSTGLDSSSSSAGLPDVGTTTSASSGSSTTPDLGSFDFSSTKASTKDTGPSFDFIDLDLSNLPPPDPNRLPKRRPPRPRIRPSSMSDYDYSYPMSENSRFPYNSNFETGFPKPTGPEFDFQFPDEDKEPLSASSA